MDEDKMRPGHWLVLVALILLHSWEDIAGGLWDGNPPSGM